MKPAGGTRITATYTVVIPFDAEAEVYLPKKDGTTEEMTLTAGTYTFTL